MFETSWKACCLHCNPPPEFNKQGFRMEEFHLLIVTFRTSQHLWAVLRGAWAAAGRLLLTKTPDATASKLGNTHDCTGTYIG